MKRKMLVAGVVGIFVSTLLIATETRQIERIGRMDTESLFLRDGVSHRVIETPKSGGVVVRKTRFNFDNHQLVWYGPGSATSNDTVFTWYEILPIADSAQIVELAWFFGDNTGATMAAHIFLNRPGELNPDTIDQFFPVPPTVVQDHSWVNWGDLTGFDLHITPGDSFWFAARSLTDPTPSPVGDNLVGNMPYHSWLAGPSWSPYNLARSFDVWEMPNRVSVLYYGVVAISDPNWWSNTYTTAGWDTIRASIFYDKPLVDVKLHWTLDGVEDSLGIFANLDSVGPAEKSVWGVLPIIASPPVEISYWIEAEHEGGKRGQSRVRTFSVLAPQHPGADILLVDDTGYDIITVENDTLSAGVLYRNILDSLGLLYESWNIEEHRGIDGSVINYGWSNIIWAGGLPGFAIPSPMDSTLNVIDHPVVQFLGAGGNFFFSAYRYFDFHFNGNEVFGPGMWVYDYLGLGVGRAANIPDTAFFGVTDDPITGGWTTTPFVTDTLLGPPDDGVVAGPDAVNIFVGAETALNAGTRFLDPITGSKVVFLPWEFESAMLRPDLFPVATVFMGRVMDWFGVVGIEEEASSYLFALSRNHPNPFSNRTTIKYEIPTRSQVSLMIYDIAGRAVTTIVNAQQNAGLHIAEWDGRDKNGMSLPNGIYFYRLHAGENSTTGKMVLMR